MHATNRIAFLAMFAVLSLYGSVTDAQPVRTPPASGTYEAYSPVRMAPVQPIASTPPPVVTVWLEVTTAGNECDIVFAPARIVRWHLRYGPYGLERKTTFVDGSLWTESVFAYDAAGHLTAKDVHGPGAGTGMHFEYVTDARGRILERRGVQALVVTAEQQRHLTAGGGTPSRWTVRYTSSGAIAETRLNSVLVRRDVFDTHGRVTSTEVAASLPSTNRIALRYVRTRAGNVSRIERQWGRRAWQPADSIHPAAGITSNEVMQITPAVERDEALLMLGAPVTHSESNRGESRSASDRYSNGCWMNAPSEIHYDASGLTVGESVNCICGFCVDAARVSLPADTLGVDTHWTEGPWVRIDESIDVTAEHHVMTPEGPRPASDLRPGDAVLRAGGGVRIVQSIRHLPTGPRRLGANVRSERGVFDAGGFVFESEQPRECMEPSRAITSRESSPSIPSRPSRARR